MKISGISLLIFTLTMLVMVNYVRFHLRGTSLGSVPVWRATVSKAFWVNCIGFFAVAMTFKMLYGFITDDINYYRIPAHFTELNFFKIRGPSPTLWWFVRPLKYRLGFDLPSFHILFGAFGFIGSLNFLKIFTLVSNIREKVNYSHNQMAIWVLLCFPNFLAWGRFFGKDSYTLFFASIFCLCASKILLGRGELMANLALMPVSIYMAFRVRPHIAGALVIAFFMALLLKTQQERVSRNVGMQALAKVYGPAIMLGIVLMVGYLTVARFTGDDVSVESTQKFLVNTSRAGAYGGSATGLREELDDNPGIIFSPAKIAMNVFNLLLAPMPWQVRGARDIIALISNIFLIGLFWKYRYKLKLTGLFNRYMLLNVIVLSVILSFTAGNVGLLLRQKTIILPFLFLLIFSREGQSETDESGAVRGRRKSKVKRQPPRQNNRLQLQPQR